MYAPALEALGAFALGCSVGATELIGRYRDEPGDVVKMWPARLYAVVNGVAAVVADVIAETQHWTFGVTGGSGERVIRLFLTGLAGMALLRTSVIDVSVGSSKVGLGPSAVLDILLHATDRMTDRKRALARAKVTAKLATGIDFGLARVTLPAYCFNLLQNTSPDEEAAVGNLVRTLTAESEMPEFMKTRVMLLALLGVVGQEVLEGAVEELRPRLTRTSESGVEQPSGARSSSRVQELLARLTGDPALQRDLNDSLSKPRPETATEERDSGPA